MADRIGLLERMPPGIQGLDTMIKGDLPKPSLTLLSGKAVADEMNFSRRRPPEVVKMSGTSHHIAKHAVDISAKGLIVYPGL
jgi:KaiC/GvpD/RAD55 family RecA-like ATPase